ncbi:GYF domain-containing protein [Luteolibacter sp. SL250]|uniref:GYF domain-containing protein n=1 Tax=Luteolibacter sp. SL250 TaxID=2995170 RepID=UPI00226F9DE4|nr:GYF domain-containing protein [Luteolibacter sp. SL250]WAC18196.1 GYF domain-containing protein [Luteolibacter sp. SL250]
MQWYYSKNGTQLGPVAQGELISKLASGEVSPADLVWKDGMGDWIPASQVAELRPTSAAAPVSTISPETPAATPYSAPVSPYSPPAAGGEVISNWLWQSIVVAVLCCPICGIPGIVFAAKVDGLKVAGDIEGAKAAASKAKMWTLIGFGVSAAFWLLYIIFAIVVGVGAAASSPTP